MIPREHRGHEKVESLKREEIHARFHKREQMRGSLEPPLSGCFPDVGFFFFSQVCGWGSPSVLQEWPDGGSTPRGAPDASAGQSLSQACGVLGAGCLVTDFGCVKAWQWQPVPRPPALRGGPFPQTGARATDCTLSPIHVCCLVGGWCC